MRGISGNTSYTPLSGPLSPLGTNLNSPQRQAGAAFDTPAAEANPAPLLLTARGAALTGSSTLGPEILSTLLQAQEIGQGFVAEEIMEDEVTRFLNARKKLGTILKSIEHPESEEKETGSEREKPASQQ